MKEARIMKENITYYLVWIICLLAGCAPTPKQIEDTTDPIPMYPDYTDIMIPTNIAPLNFLLRNDADAMQVTLKGLGNKTKRASSFLMMSPVGGAIGPVLMGYVADNSNMSLSFIIPFVSFCVVLFYSWYADVEGN